MLTTSTHDTKHGEDARMRIHVLSELPEEWKSKLREWAESNKDAKTEINGHPAPDSADEYLYYQNLLGMWPPHQAIVDDDLASRMKLFMNKALKEAKIHTSWINPSNEYDAAAEDFVEQTLRGPSAPAFLASFIPFAERVAALAAWGSVSQIALKMMSPGVIDTYQGGELWDLSLVDPDNRRPVDYATRQQRLQMLMDSVAAPAASVEQRTHALADLRRQRWTGDLKLLYVAMGLGVRKQHPDLLARGAYLPLQVEGPHSEHLIAFARAYPGKLLLTVAARWFASLLSAPDSLDDLKERLHDTFVDISSAGSETSLRKTTFRNVLSGSPVQFHEENGKMKLRAGEVLAGLPAVWLISD